jgi:hypothetical protein
LLDLLKESPDRPPQLLSALYASIDNRAQSLDFIGDAQGAKKNG